MACRQIWLSPLVPHCHSTHLTKLGGKRKEKKPCKLQLHQKIKKLKKLIKNNLKRKKKKTTLTKNPQSRR
jgi:hypothetical protein